MWRVAVAVAGLSGLLAACDRGGAPATVMVCAPLGEANLVGELVLTPRALGTPAELSQVPTMIAEANDQSVVLASGPSYWCGVASDQFDVVTPADPLLVSPGDQVIVENPLPDDPQFATATVQGPLVAPPANNYGYRVWPDAGWSGGFRRDLDEKGRLTFEAPDEPGDYVVSVFFQYGETDDMFESSEREGKWAFYLKVED